LELIIASQSQQIGSFGIHQPTQLNFKAGLLLSADQQAAYQQLKKHCCPNQR
jgi:hypothetical protein